jgi:hypothetical protein
MQPRDLNLTTDIVGHQRYLFLQVPPELQGPELARRIDDLGQNLHNLHDGTGTPSADALGRGCYQLLRGEPERSSPQNIEHPALLAANLLIRLEASDSTPLLDYEGHLRQGVEPLGINVESLVGVQRPRSYTSHAMTQFAYTPAQAPGPAERHPLGVVTPMNKTPEWWDLDWMHRESFFLPRYDADENMIAPGHSLVAEAGVACITRRLMHAPNGYGLESDYDFVGYFEFAEADAPIFDAVMAGLRDPIQNPEWKYVREGPEWWGRRIRQAAEWWG